jgi:poly(A) polymerase
LVEATILERAQHPVSRRDIDRNVLKVLHRLIGAGHVAYLVGGGVRDLMMRRRPKDFDVATSAHPNQVRELFRNSRLIGRRFRLVHVFFGPQIIEVATFRRHSEEVSASDDPMIRHDNTFGTPEEDAFRRDFTVNALFYDPATFRVIDYTQGVADLGAALIRTIGDAELRMREDPVRIIRAVRFAVKLGFEIEPATRAAMERHRSDLAKASIPRLVEETYRTLAIPDAAQALILLERLGILELLLPVISEHLSQDPAVIELEQTATVRHLEGMGRLVEAEEELSRGFILGCLYADYRLSPPPKPPEARAALVEALRARGFSRADTEQMRLLLDAVAHIVARSRTLRRLSRRPYFREAQKLCELIKPPSLATLAEPGTGSAAYRQATDSSFGTSAGGRVRRRRRGGRGRARRSPKDQSGTTSDLNNADGVKVGMDVDSAAASTVDNADGEAALVEQRSR